MSPCEPDSYDFYFDKTTVKSKLFTGVHAIICLNVLYEFIKCWPIVFVSLPSQKYICFVI